MKLQDMFSSKKNSTLNALISSFNSLKDNLSKYNDLHLKAFLNLQNWASSENNTAIQDISSKLMSLSFKLNDELNDERIIATKEIVALFKRIKEYESKKAKSAEELNHAEKLLKKREDELVKCPLSKNILDYEARLYKARVERDKLELKYYDLCNEMEATKLILFKKNFLKYNDLLLKQNHAENILLNAMQNLLIQIPDVISEDLNEMSYDNQEICERIFDEAKENLNYMAKQKSFLKNDDQKNKQPISIQLKKRSTFIKQQKFKEKPRKSCPALTSNLPNDKIFPSLKNLHLSDPPTYSDSERSLKVTQSQYSVPSAPPLIEKSKQ